jgi:hypothetical protein
MHYQKAITPTPFHDIVTNCNASLRRRISFSPLASPLSVYRSCSLSSSSSFIGISASNCPFLSTFLSASAFHYYQQSHLNFFYSFLSLTQYRAYLLKIYTIAISLDAIRLHCYRCRRRRHRRCSAHTTPLCPLEFLRKKNRNTVLALFFFFSFLLLCISLPLPAVLNSIKKKNSRERFSPRYRSIIPFVTIISNTTISKQTRGFIFIALHTHTHTQTEKKTVLR